MKQNNKSKLASTIQTRMKNISNNNAVLYTEFGTIGSNNSLTLDTINDTIPKTDYSKCNSCSALNKGDRVVVLWVAGEPVIIDKLKGE